jgi:flavin-dependent dehydrogenase
MESWNFLERLGMPLSEMNLPRITQLRVTSAKGTVIDHPLDLGGFGISRYTLDNALASIAKKIGVEVKEECRAEEIIFESELFRVKIKNEEFKSSVVIGAFGKRSNLDRKLNRSFELNPQPPSGNWVGVKYHVHANVPANSIELHNFDSGYCGISKVDGEKYCLCYLTKAENLRRSSGSIPEMEEKILSKNLFLKNYFSDRKQFLFEEPVTISQITFENKLPVEKNILMIGDAAGMIAPLCGNGMSMALHASLIIFPIIEKFLQQVISREQMEKNYATQWRKLFAAKLRIGRMLQPLMVRSSLSNTSIAILKTVPRLMDQIVKATHGKPF